MGKITFNTSTDIPDQTGRVFLITGGTSGLGAGTVSNLAAHNPGHIYFTGRSKGKAEALISELKQKHPNTSVSFLECDATSLESVRSCAAAFRAQSQRLDVLMCNAGIMAQPGEVTKDGFEVQWQVNHLSHALLIRELLPVLQATAKEHGDVRIVALSSSAYKTTPSHGIEFDSLRTAQTNIGGLVPGGRWARYGQSKLANMLYADELAKRYPDIMTISVHPGLITGTELFKTVPFYVGIAPVLLYPGDKVSLEEGPYNQLWAATCPRDKLKAGTFYIPVGVEEKRSTKFSKDEKLAERLWTWTEEALDGVKSS